MTDVEIYDPRTLYDTIADLYANAARTYFPFAPDRLVELADPQPGHAVLDVACGPGPIALRAAHRVGPTGSVVGVDISQGMVNTAQRDALSLGLTNTEFHVADFHKLPFPPATFDRVLCGFALFFAEDPVAVAHNMWQLVGPDGVLAISMLAADFFSPLFDIYLQAIPPGAVDLDPLLPSQKIASADDLATILTDAGVPDATVSYETATIPIPTMDHWWDLVASTGPHRIDQALPPDVRAQVHAAVDAEATRRSITTINLGVNYAVAHRPT